MDWYISTFLFLLGLGIGSFINVVSIRYQLDEFVFKKTVLSGRSHCPVCSTTLKWYELIPLLSFLGLRGRCRTCGTKISWQYPIVELVTGLLFVLVPLRIESIFSSTPRLLHGEPSLYQFAVPLWLIFAAVLVLVAVIDFRERVIPDELNIAIVGLGVFYIVAKEMLHAFGPLEGSFMGKYALVLGFRSDIYINHILAFLVGLVFFGTIILASRGRAMGMGDLKLAAAAGIFLGWPDIVFALAFSFIIGSVFSVGLLAQKKKSLKDAVPFGPFIVGGIFTVLFAGQEILEFYFSIFNL